MVVSSSHDSGASSTLRRYQVYCSLPMPEGPVFFGASPRSHPAKLLVAESADSVALDSALSLAGTRPASVRSAALCSSKARTAPTHKSAALPAARLRRAASSSGAMVRSFAASSADCAGDNG